MKDRLKTLMQIEDLARATRKSFKRGYTEQAQLQAEDLYLLAQDLMPTALTRCVICGSKPNLAQTKRSIQNFRPDRPLQRKGHRNHD